MHGEYQDLPVFGDTVRILRAASRPPITGMLRSKMTRFGFEGQDLIDSFLAVFCFSTHFPFGIVLEQNFSDPSARLHDHQQAKFEQPFTTVGGQSPIWDLGQTTY